MHHVRPALLLSLSALIFGAPVAQDTSVDLLRAAVTFMHAHPHNSGKGPLKVDSRILPAAVGIAFSVQPEAPGRRHDSVTIRAVEIQSISQVISPERSAQCAAFAPPDCMYGDASVVAAFAIPVIRGDTGTVEVLLLKSFHMSAADSAERVKRPGGMMGVRLARAQRAFGRVIAVRESGTWVVKEFKLLGQT